MENSDKNLRINIESLVKSKSNKFAKYIPKFVLRALAKIIHQDEINFVLDNYGSLKGVDFATATLKHLNISYEVIGLENINLDQSKRYIFASNHPMGGLDGMILIEIFGNIFNKNIKFVVNDLLMNLTPLQSIFIPVNKFGRQNTDNARLLHESYSSESQILYFPAGLCSRMIKGEITDPEWKKSFVSQAIKYNREIVPIFFDGKNSKLFYRFANFRKFLGIKLNIEFILLPHEMFKKRDSSFKIFIGKPIKIAERTEDNKAKSWCQKIRDQVYSLK